MGGATFPESAFVAREGHDRGGWCCESDAEYADTTKARLLGAGVASIEGISEAHEVLWAYEAELQTQRDAAHAAESARLNALLEVHPVTGEALRDLPPSCQHSDLLPLPDGMEPSASVAQKAQILAASLAAVCAAEHIRYGNPFCPECRPGRALGSLMLRLVLDARFDPTGIDCASAPEEASARRSVFFTYDELGDLPEPEWLIDGIVPQGGIGFITGRDGTYKTFLAVDIALTTVLWPSGSDWHGGRAVDVGGFQRALILEGEGVGSMRKRIDAALESRGATLSAPQRESLVIRNGAVDLYGGSADFHTLLGYVTDFQPDVVIVDTLNRSAGSADQNSASDMSVITARLHAIAQASESKAQYSERCTVIVVAHTGKSDEDARGSSAIEDDADFVLHCKKREDRLTVTVAKQKDGESGFTLDLLARPFGESLALVEPPAGGPVLWSSSSARARVVGALRTLAPMGYVSQAEIAGVTAEDVFGQQSGPVNRGSVSREIAHLLEQGAVTQVRPGVKQYRLAEGWDEQVPS